MEKFTSGAELPVGFGLALEQYHALDYFFSLPTETKQQIINHVHTIKSKNEMLEYVESTIATNRKD
ncbi:hypothetical protein [Lacrimispora sp. JR3]|uniref:hypothetical protein n=1 Tax=Lacrimispora sinapis TaxID=3111456 RepID=UPI003749AAF9